jgi:exodeoxyribonuclease V beta subunit
VRRDPPHPAPPRRSDVRVSSYSALVRSAHDVPPDAAPERDVDAGGGADEIARVSSAVLALSGFPRGSRAGVGYHAVCEHLDFPACTSVPPIRDEVRRQLATVGLADEASVEAVARSVVDVVHTPLGDDGAPGPRLVEVSRADRLDELEFLLGVGGTEGLRAAPLAEAFREALPPRLAEPVADRVRSLAFVPVRGALRGFVDLTFRHGGRLWLVDYKTNHLGDAVDDYAAPSLERAMIEGDYVLQYHLYAIALRRWLRRRLPGFSWDESFGGVRWLFVRGMTPATGASRGVFADRPDEARLDRIEQALGGGS